jgi:hypothetical protein
VTFAVDRRRVVHETIDGEAILIHMETGFYYSLDGAGAEIWNALAAGNPSEEVATDLRTRYQAPPGEIEDAISSLAAELCREGLLDETDAPLAGNGTPVPGNVSANGATGSRRDFATPVLHRYTDMADFMLVDPIHEVDESGWPNRKPVH